MNRLRKMYCRAYQGVFRILIPVLPYRKPKMLGSTKDVAGILNKKNIDSVLLVTDPMIRKLGITADLEKSLKCAGIKLTVFDRTVANPTTDNVEEAYGLFRDNGCKALIGFGGGSSMDCAKAVGAQSVHPNKSLGKMEGILKVHARLPLLIAIPTTAGTGSETTIAAVIVDSKTRHKYPINDFCLIPRYAVLDPEVTKSLPPFVTATTGMDALTHAVEAYIGNSTTPGTRKDALRATNLIFRYIRKAYADGNDMQARKQMIYASYLAGCAFTKSYVGYVHAVAHSLGGKYNIAHGLANAVLLPYVLEAYGESAYKKLHELADEACISDIGDNDESGAKKFIAAVRLLQLDLGIGDKLDGIREEDIDELAAYADKEGNPLYPVPKLMDKTELAQFYRDVMK